MKIVDMCFLGALFVLVAGAALLVSASPALAGPASPTKVPGPSTLVLLTVGAAAVAVAARWIRRP